MPISSLVVVVKSKISVHSMVSKLIRVLWYIWQTRIALCEARRVEVDKRLKLCVYLLSQDHELRSFLGSPRMFKHPRRHIKGAEIQDNITTGTHRHAAAAAAILASVHVIN